MSTAVAPTPIGNHCKGTYGDGTPNIQFRCLKKYDVDGTPLYNCAGKRYFLANCPKINQLCSSLSGAWVAASTVCAQRLY